MVMLSRKIGWVLGTVLCVSWAAADVPIRIAQFNCEEGLAETPQRREATGNQLTIHDFDGPGPNRGLAPDILAIEEARLLSELQSYRDDYFPGFQVIRGSVQTNDPGGNNQACIFRGEYQVVHFAELAHGGPRRHHRLILRVPDSPHLLILYIVHFKCCSDPQSVQTRAIEANNLANRVAADHAYGIDIDGDGRPDVRSDYYIVIGDLNHNDFEGTTIDPLLVGGSNRLPTGLHDMRVETLLGRYVPQFVGGTWSTRSNLTNRLDYILVSDAIYDQFDTNRDGVWTQAELNAAGFVYFSPDDGGRLANGDPDATVVASDHTPVIVDFVLPGPAPRPGDINRDGRVDQGDLGILLAAWDTRPGDPNWNPQADLNADGVIDQADLGILLANWTG